MSLRETGASAAAEAEKETIDRASGVSRGPSGISPILRPESLYGANFAGLGFAHQRKEKGPAHLAEPLYLSLLPVAQELLAWEPAATLALVDGAW